MATHKAGQGIYKNLRVGDSVINGKGEDISKRDDFCVLDHKTASRVSNGAIHIRGEDPLFGEGVDLWLSAEEWAALKKKF